MKKYYFEYLYLQFTSFWVLTKNFSHMQRMNDLAKSIKQIFVNLYMR